MTATRFKKIIWEYYRTHKRDMPWRRTRDPYRILVSEIMLQQTQVDRVRGFYEDFIKAFPNFGALARAKNQSVLRAWQGLGYNRRALLLKRAAEAIVHENKGKLPRERGALEALPGIGKGTSGALRAFAFNEPEIFIETNIRRVFIHFFFPRRKKVTDAEIERYIKRTLDTKNPREWYWALMDYGAMLGKRGAAQTKNNSTQNPNRRSAHYKKQSAFVGSNRELRGKILRFILRAGQGKKQNQINIRVTILAKEFGASPKKIDAALNSLRREGFLNN